jgi:hypothetical protein
MAYPGVVGSGSTWEATTTTSGSLRPKLFNSAMLAFLGKVLPRGVVPGEYVNAEYEERPGIVLGFHDMEERLSGLEHLNWFTYVRR